MGYSSYSEEQKQVALNMLKSPYNLSIKEVSERKGMTTKTLYNWLKKAQQEGQSMPKNSKNNPEKWSGQEKLNVVIETASMTAQELSEYCRSKGLYPEQVKQWKSNCIQGFVPIKPDKANRQDQKRIRQLEKEIQRKDKALAETTALLVLQKKLQTLWEDEDV